MTTKKRGAQPSNGKARVKALIKNHKSGKEGNLNSATHGAIALQSAYYSSRIDRRTQLGICISSWEEEYARHLGQNTFRHLPITVREKVRLAIGNRLFQMFFLPEPGNTTGIRDLRSSENTLSRILSELGLEQRQKDVTDIVSALAEEAE